ncbi:hypothetical protein EJP617_33320 [Erwinia sp. Ejp617]|nr:hypothetical protein EJP617_33320 [Erwinia sp. Ejp617]
MNCPGGETCGDDKARLKAQGITIMTFVKGLGCATAAG